MKTIPKLTDIALEALSRRVGVAEALQDPRGRAAIAEIAPVAGAVGRPAARGLARSIRSIGRYLLKLREHGLLFGGRNGVFGRVNLVARLQAQHVQVFGGGGGRFGGGTSNTHKATTNGGGQVPSWASVVFLFGWQRFRGGQEAT